MNLLNQNIILGKTLLSNLSKHLQAFSETDNIVIITDDNVRELYGNRLKERLQTSLKFGSNLYPVIHLLSIPPGESSKSQSVKTNIENQMLALGCKRDTLILALGGGVVGDLAGFIAATYMRGIPFVQIPTTLLAMVDSSVGGKTGINTPYGKNLIGAFYMPNIVVIDLDVLKTLTQEQVINGLIEAIKMFLTHDAESFKLVQQELCPQTIVENSELLEKIVRRAIEIKMGVVSRDEKESNERKVLNFGHTVGHALERLSEYGLLHGRAVALGILLESKAAQLSGQLFDKDFKQIQKCFLSLGINTEPLKQFSAEDIMEAMQMDKKNKQDQVHYLVLRKIGELEKNGDGFTHEMEFSILKKALETLNL